MHGSHASHLPPFRHIGIASDTASASALRPWCSGPECPRARPHVYPLSELYDDHEHGYGSEPDESNEIVDDEMQVGREIDDGGADGGECSW